MVGETTTYDAIVESAERMTGRTFLRKYVGRSELVELAKDPAKKFYNQVGALAVSSACKCMVDRLRYLLTYVL